jgi:hypothetical protein
MNAKDEDMAMLRRRTSSARTSPSEPSWIRMQHDMANQGNSYLQKNK